jgi:hypothetical protein
MRNTLPLSNRNNIISVLNPIGMILRYFFFKLNRKIALTGISLLACSLFIFYIIQINNLAQQNVSLKNYQKNIKELSVENELKENNLAGVGLMENVDQLAKSGQFEKVTHINYIQTAGNFVVMAK